jgi:hypothetical protein
MLNLFHLRKKGLKVNFLQSQQMKGEGKQGHGERVVFFLDMFFKVFLF